LEWKQTDRPTTAFTPAYIYVRFLIERSTVAVPYSMPQLTGVRTWGQMGSTDPHWKIDEKIKKLIIMFMLYFESNQGRQM